MATYPGSVSDSEWSIPEPFLPVGSGTLRGRPVKHSRRSIIDSILYILRSGGAWRMMPHDLPHWKTCYHYFRLWTALGHWERIHDIVRDRARTALGKKKAPTAGIIDSQSVRTGGQPGPRGYDAGKKIMGRKRHILVDLWISAGPEGHPGELQDRDGARTLPGVLLPAFGWIRLIWGDSGYSGPAG